VITVSKISHDLQRYNTCGDWRFSPQDELFVFISDCGNWQSELLVAVHEIVEAFLCKATGVSEAEVDKWDMANLNEKDPGILKGCPYRNQHISAEFVERLVARLLNTDWKEHEERLDKLYDLSALPEEKSNL